MISRPNGKRPLISVVIIAYNMAREIPRTVQSFLPPYQQGISFEDIEIIVMENGSNHPVDQDIVSAWPECVRYVQVKNPLPSPASALNQGVSMCRGDWVCPVIDGARMITPGIFQLTNNLIASHKNPVITTVGYHLGHKPQQKNVLEGYNQNVEDSLLSSIDWPNKPYDLFKVSSLGLSALGNWLAPIAESNVLILNKEFYHHIGGYDEKFNHPGGGIVNLDFFKRCVEHPESQYILLLGEASFHQYHGGVTTSRGVDLPSVEDQTKTTWQIYADQYFNIHGKTYEIPQIQPLIYGHLNQSIKEQTIKAALHLHNSSN